jgi:CheY-like chemotaxis protein
MAKRRILMVGEPKTAAVLKEYLGHIDIYESESIEHCDDALMVLRRQPFDLVLLLSLNATWRTWSSLGAHAQHIEGSSAILFLKQLRALLDPPPVIVVSGSVRPEAEAAALANGAVAWFYKPINLEEFGQLLAFAFETPKSEESGQ